MQTHLQTQNVSQNEPPTQAKTINDFSANNNMLQRHAALTESVIQCGGGKFIGPEGGWHVHREGKFYHMKKGGDKGSRLPLRDRTTWNGVVEHYRGYYAKAWGKKLEEVNEDSMRKMGQGWDDCKKYISENYPSK